MNEWGMTFKRRDDGVVEVTVSSGPRNSRIYSHAIGRFQGGWKLEWEDDLLDLNIKMRLHAIIVFALSNLTV